MIKNALRKYTALAVVLSVTLLSACKESSSSKNNAEDTSGPQTQITVTEKTTVTTAATTEPTEAITSSTVTTTPSTKKQQGEIAPEIVRVVQAYKTGDTSKLTDPKDVYVYNKAVEVIYQVIKPNMTDYQKEVAIHDYIISNTHYDLDHLDQLAKTNPDSFTAYGLLKNRKSVCLGYTRTFQLFMDMLDIECITIHSTANGGEEHAWNMIKLGKIWYHVDVTWDDPIPDDENIKIHTFLNVTSSFMKSTGHEWDESKFPKATDFFTTSSV